jgi:hypothetical protein
MSVTRRRRRLVPARPRMWQLGRNAPPRVAVLRTPGTPHLPPRARPAAQDPSHAAHAEALEGRSAVFRSPAFTALGFAKVS